MKNTHCALFFLFFLIMSNLACKIFSAGTFNHFSTYKYNCSIIELNKAVNELYKEQPNFKPLEKRTIPKSFDSAYASLLNRRYADSNYFCFNIVEKKLRLEMTVDDWNDSICKLELAQYATLSNNLSINYYICNNNPKRKEIQQMITLLEFEILPKIETILKEQTGRKIIRSKLYPK